MKTDITVYHYVYDEKNQTDKYEIRHFYNVSWQGGKGASVNKGYEQSNDIKIRIFHKDNPELNVNMFKIGDVVVGGIVNKKISKQSELPNAYNVTTIIPHERGSLETNHIELGAK